MFLYYATAVGDYAKVLEHHIMEEEWVKAVDVLNRQVGLCHSMMGAPCLILAWL